MGERVIVEKEDRRVKKGKRIPGHRHCPNLVRDAGKKPPPRKRHNSL